MASRIKRVQCGVTATGKPWYGIPGMKIAGREEE